MGDVLAEHLVLEVDGRHARIGFLHRLPDVGRLGDDAEHAAAVRYQLAVLDGGAGVEYERVGHIVQTGDLLALFVGLRIAAGRHADAAGGIVRPLDVDILELFVDDRIENIEQVGVQAGQDCLRLRSTHL